MALVGMYFLCMNESFTMQIGDIILLISTIVYSVRFFLIDNYVKEANGVTLSLVQFVVCAIVSAIVSFMFEDTNWEMLQAVVFPLLYAGIMCSGVAYTLQIIGQKDTPPTIANLLMSLEAVFSVIAGWLLLNQRLSVRELVGCCILFCAIILAQLPPISKLVSEKTNK